MKRFGLATIAFSAMLAVACNGNGRDTTRNDTNTVGTAGSADSNTLSNADQEWVKDMLMDGMAEVDLGQMAKTKATNAEVKQFADRMMRDHTKAGDELKQIASRYSITPPAQMDDKHRDLKNTLSQKSGADFDRQYIDAMVDDHQDAINQLQKHASEDRFGDNKGAVKPERSNNPAETSINNWAAMALPVVREHLDMAKQIQDRLRNRNTTR